MKMRVGLAYNLKGSLSFGCGFPEDIVEEFDTEETIDAIEDVLLRAGYDVVRLGGNRDFIDKLKENLPGLVFNIAEGFGTRSREAHIPAILEFFGIPYTGSDPLTLALTLEKALTKRVVLSLGIHTPEFIVIDDPSTEITDFPLPAVVKPLYEGSSMGIRLSSRVLSYEELNSVVREMILKYNEPVLVERFLQGREFTVALLSDGDGLRVLGAMEICPKEMDISSFLYSLEVKRNWQRMVEYKVNPSWYTGELKRRIDDSVLRIARTIGIVDFARFDFRFDEQGQFHFLEVNPLPGLNPTYSDFVILARGLGMAYDDLIISIVESAKRRYGIKGSGCIQRGSARSPC